jgi:DNA-binding transcriptional ArsR family regulator
VASWADRQLEQTIKAFASRHRIQILRALQREPGLSVAEIARRVRLNIKTTSAHLKRLALAGLVSKRAEGRTVRCKLTGRARDVLKFLRKLE